MGQINIIKGNHSKPPLNMRGFGFDAIGNPVIIDETGVDIPLGSFRFTIVATLGIGDESALPNIFDIGDVYVSKDSFKVFTAIDSVTWAVSTLYKGQFVTDISNTEDMPPLYQYFNTLMPIANCPIEMPNGLPE